MDKKQAFISVIIPVYNMEKYLDRCMESVLTAAIDNMQIILVDDGSKDTSPAICDRYAAEHSNVEVIHQENGGLSAARNTGMAAACGEYLFFLDSDDRVHCDLFRKFAEFMADREIRPDMILCNAEFVHMTSDRRIPMTLKLDPSEIENVSGQEALGKILNAEPKFEWYCWRYFYLRKYIQEAGHQFPVGRYYEDVKWTPQVLARANTVCYLPALSVHYTWCRPDSIVNSPSMRKALDKLYICQDACRFASEKIEDLQTSRLMLESHAELYLSAFRDYCNGLKELYPNLKECAYLLQHSRSRIGTVMYRLTKIFGFRIGSWLTALLIKIRE